MSGDQYTDKKNKGWFKGVLSTREETAAAYADVDAPIPAAEPVREEPRVLPIVPPASSLPIYEQDNLTLALKVAVENILSDRQLAITKSEDREANLHAANETINRLRNEVGKKEHQLLEKDKELRSLEDKLTGKQMSYDQLLEDYKDYQSTSNMGMDNLKYQLEKERSKYTKMSDELTKLQYEAMKRSESYEERIRDLEAENLQLMEVNRKMALEKASLLQSVTDFTERMSFSFNQPDKKAAAPIPTSDSVTQP